MQHLRARLLLPAAALSLALVALMLPAVSATAAQPRVQVASGAPIPATYSVVPVTINTTFDVALAQPNKQALSDFIASLSNPASPNYRHYLTTQQFAQRFGATDATVETVSTYMKSFGLKVNSLSAGRVLLHISGTTNNIAHAFDASITTVRSSSGELGAQFTDRATLPANIAQQIQGIYGLSTVVPKTRHLLHASATSAPSTCSSAQAGASASSTTPNSLGGYTLQQQAALYGFSGAYANGNIGTGQIIGVYELGTYNQADLNVFFNCYGLSPSITNTNIDGGATGGYSDEATLDIEEAAALAPGAKIQVYTGPNSSSGSGPLDVYQAIADENTATVVTTSWGDCEVDPANNPSTEQVIFQQMAAQGQTVLSASGDNGSSDCHGITTNSPAVDDPSSQPYVTSVGGLTVNNISPLNQTVWNSNGGGGGGGVSQVWSRPTWQKTTGATASQTMRMVPDLSVMADPNTGFIQYFTGSNSGVVVCHRNCSSGWSSIGGTSIGSPLMSALVAVSAQSCGVARLGFINPTLYQMSAAGIGFNDVTTGTNDLFSTGSYSAGAGYDLASGLGSPNGAAFINGLCPPKVSASKSSLVANTTSTVVGSVATVTLALKDVNGNPIVNYPVAVSAKASDGTLVINGDQATATSNGNALDTVTTGIDGTVSFDVTSTTPGTITVSATTAGVTLASATIAMSAAAPGAPTISKLKALVAGFSLTVTAPASGTITSYQYSINGGTSWVSFSSKGTVTVSKLAKSKLYSVIVRAIGAGGTGKASAPKSVITLK